MTGTQDTDMPGGSLRFALQFASLFFAISFTGLLVSTNFSLLQDGDTFWHIATGRWIAENRQVPSQDVFSHTFLGQIWLAKEWLSQVLLHFAYAIGGWKGVNAFGLLAISATVALLSTVCFRYYRFSIAIAVVVLASVFASVHYLARPHLLAYPVMMVWTMGVVFAADKRQLPSLWLLPLMTLWANMHGGFTLGLLLAGLMSLETLAAAPRERLKALAMRHAGFLALATIAALITPFGIQSILITPKIFGLGEVLDHVSEWKSPDFHTHEFHLVVLMALVGFALYGGLRLNSLRLLAVLLLSFLMFKHVRAMPVFAFMMPILMANPVTTQFGAVSLRQQLADNVFDPIFGFCQRNAARVPIVAAIILAIGLFVAAQQEMLKEEGLTKPIGALEFAEANDISGKVYNDYDFGGYLIFHGVPTYIDGRAELYGRDFFNAYYSATWQLQGGDLFKLLDEHYIAWTLLRPDSGGAVALDRSPDWQCVYMKGIAAIHVRKGHPGTAEAIKAAEDEPCQRSKTK